MKNIDKKGAIEFSMTTIMVIIIGVAVLALGLAWIRGTFQQVSTITEASLEAAETIVGEVAFSGKASAPATITMEAKDAKKFKVLVKNVDSGDHTYKIFSSLTDNCFSKVDPAEEIALGAGEVGEFVGGIISKGGVPCPRGYNKIITIDIKEKRTALDYSDAIIYSTEAIVLQVA